MTHKFIFPLMVVLALVLSSCNLPSSQPKEAPEITNIFPTANVQATAKQANISTQAPSNTPLPTATMTPTATNTPETVAYLASDTYIDDRSTPSQVIVSYFNAVNRKEYLRAYAYWKSPGSSLGSFTSFANGYADTASVDLVFGQITGDAGAGQIYYTVPVILKAKLTNGTKANWAACYVIHHSQPGFYGAPPINPMGIDRGSAKISDMNAKDTDVLLTACNGYPSGGNPVSASGTTLDIDNTNYLDNRSGPIETISSLLNALNLKEYVRAYSYFQNPSTFPGPYNSYAAGFSDTDVVTVTFGSVQNDAGAGNLYYKVPLAMKVLTTTGSIQTFVGCYTLHLSQPSFQGTPPFRPLGIKTGKFTKVDNSLDANALLPSACK